MGAPACPAPALHPATPRPQAVVTLGAAAGGVLGGWLLDRAGRKLSLLLCTLPFVAGFAVITAAKDVWTLLGGRLFTGLACGIASLVAPVSVPRARTQLRRRRSGTDLSPHPGAWLCQAALPP